MNKDNNRGIQMNMNIGDLVEYNGYDYEGFHNYEQNFIKNNLIVGKSYIILGIISYSRIDIKIPWYRIKIDDNETYWLPYLCFKFDIKKKYGLR